MSYISSLKLYNMRCYDSVYLENLPLGLVVLYGANGAGKTNVLEAISLLVPGRGLRGAKATDIQCNIAPNPWAVSAVVQMPYAPVSIGTGLDIKTGKTVVRINGETVKSQAALSEYLSCIWLTPQMDRLFLDSSQERRRFLDQMIFAFDPSHAGRLTRYKNALAQRSKILREHINEPAWLTSLEKNIAETGVAIAAARLDFIQRLQSVFTGDIPFPAAILSAQGTIESLLSQTAALEVEDMFAYQLHKSRAVDSVTGGAATGIHKSDLSVIYADKNMPADQCSTGEQKSLLIGIILAHARLVKSERGTVPLLLLDEVAAHLDENRRNHLYDILIEMGGQVWLTGTDRNLFSHTENHARFFHVAEACIQSVPKTHV